MIKRWGRDYYDQGGILLNVIPGGSGGTRRGIPLSEEHRLKIGATIRRMIESGHYRKPSINPHIWTDEERLAWGDKVRAMMTQETRARIGNTKRRRYATEDHPWKGRRHSEQSKELNRVAHLGKKWTAEQRAAAAAAERPAHKEATKAKISESIVQHYGVQFEVTFPDGHTEIVTNLRAFCKAYDLSDANMRAVASGRLKQTKGYRARRLTAS